MTAPERFAESQIPLAPRAVAVDTVITVKGFFDWALGERLPLA